MKRSPSIICLTAPQRFTAGVLLTFLGLTGCSSEQLKTDYTGFEAAYAESSNRQMLLNLARLDQHDPTYFLSFGQINVSYVWSGSLSAGGDTTFQKGTPTPITPNASLSAGATAEPSFQFIPATDEKVAQELLKALPPNVLYTLFQQGWPVDQLMRLMVERCEIQLPGQNKLTTYTNSPVRGDLFSYAMFLRICAIAREFQLDGHLKLEATSDFIPLVEGWSTKTAPDAKALMDAQDKGLTYRLVDGSWELGTNTLIPKFTLEEGSESTYERLKDDPRYNEYHSVENMYHLLKQGFAVQGDYADKNIYGSHVVLRSFMSVLAAAAQEETTFPIALDKSPEAKLIPPDEYRPILRLRWGNQLQTQLLDPLIALNYRGQTYQVTDPAPNGIDESSTWNRDVFRLVTQLASQVSVDISKFPLPTTLQVTH